MFPPIPHPPTATDAPAREPPRPGPAAQPARHLHRERDFGIGYGNSSGYGCEEHYARPWGPERFRCV